MADQKTGTTEPPISIYGCSEMRDPEEQFVVVTEYS